MPCAAGTEALLPKALKALFFPISCGCNGTGACSFVSGWGSGMMVVCIIDDIAGGAVLPGVVTAGGKAGGLGVAGGTDGVKAGSPMSPGIAGRGRDGVVVGATGGVADGGMDEGRMAGRMADANAAMDAGVAHGETDAMFKEAGVICTVIGAGVVICIVIGAGVVICIVIGAGIFACIAPSIACAICRFMGCASCSPMTGCPASCGMMPALMNID